VTDVFGLNRRTLLGSALAAPLMGRAFAENASPASVATPNWNLGRFLQVMKESGRPISMSQASFDAIQARKPAALAQIEAYLKSHLGSADPAVMQAFAELPREYYHYNDEDHVPTPSEAYETNPKPWAIGYGSALSDYLGQAYMSQVCAPKPGDITLEIGTGTHRGEILFNRNHPAAGRAGC
jgi:protein-L-isoaspartate(D-aspartate) O-methyltransferase